MTTRLASAGRFAVLAGVAMSLLIPPTAASDTSPPIVTYTIDGIVGTNDWYRGSSGGNYVVVHWAVSDPESPLTSTSGCEPAIQIPGPSTGTTRTCSATSSGGTTTVTTKLVKIDATPPVVTAAASRSPDLNGWYNHSLTVSFSGSDATSGVASCSSSVPYSGPDNPGAAIYGTCTDNAGNLGSGALSFQYDATQPTSVQGALSRQPDANGWYNHPLPISFSGSDALSGLASCSSPTYSGPDRADAVVSGSCSDKAGNTASAAVSFDYDAKAPTVTAAASRSPDLNGWFNHPLTVSFSGSDATSGLAGCSPAATYGGPDNAGAAAYGSCSDNAGNTGTGKLAFKYDATPPTAKGTVGRSPDANGWYNHPLTVSFSGTDATSGLAGCSSASYSGPDTAGAAVSGSCVDKAGNTTSSSVSFDYGATPPAGTLSAGRVPDANGWYNHALTVSFSGSDATSGLAGCSPAATYGG